MLVTHETSVKEIHQDLSVWISGIAIQLYQKHYSNWDERQQKLEWGFSLFKWSCCEVEAAALTQNSSDPDLIQVSGSAVWTPSGSQKDFTVWIQIYSVYLRIFLLRLSHCTRGSFHFFADTMSSNDTRQTSCLFQGFLRFVGICWRVRDWHEDDNTCQGFQKQPDLSAVQ